MQVRLFADLAERAGEKRVAVDVESGSTVGEALDTLVEEYPALEARVLGADGGVRSEVNVLHNGTDVRVEPDAFETRVEREDELALFPPVSGG